MNTARTMVRTASLGVLLLLAEIFFGGSSALAITYNLRAGAAVKTMPGGESVTVWGFADDTVAGPGNGTVSVPGPVLTVPPGDTGLIINLTNNLTEAATGVAGGVPVSLVIPGQPAALAPVKFSDGSGRQRTAAFTVETAPGSTQTYSWNDVQPGTFLYQSGSHPSVQIPMGLYGVMKKDFASGLAYDGVPYDNEAIVVFSGIDPAFNAAVTSGTYGTGAWGSTINYSAVFYLVNGAVFSGDPSNPGTAPIVTAPVLSNERLLIRFANAGLKTHVPAITDVYFGLVAEDGHRYPYARLQYSTLLPALKTLDAIVISKNTGTLAIFDRALHTVNRNVNQAGGMVTYLKVAQGGVATAIPEPIYFTPTPTPTPTPTSTSTPTPTPTSTATQTPTLTPDPPAPTPAANPTTDTPVNVLSVSSQQDAYSTAEDSVLTIEAARGLLANDSAVTSTGEPVSKAALHAMLLTGPAHGSLTLDPAGAFTYKPASNYFGADSFSYHTMAGSQGSAATLVTIDVKPVNDAPVARNDRGSMTRIRKYKIQVLANDTDVDGDLSAALIRIVKRPSSGRALIQRNRGGWFTFVPRKRFAKSVSFSYRLRDKEGAWSNVATVSMRLRSRRS